MEVKTEPFTLKVIDIDDNYCLHCQSELMKRKTTRKEKIKSCMKCNWTECGYCRYQDRPFGAFSSSLHNHYPNGCSCESYPYDLDCECEFRNIDVFTITCNNCRIPKCNDCKVNIIHGNYKSLDGWNKICITNTGRLVCNCDEYNRNTRSPDDFQNLCSPCNHSLNEGNFNSIFICNECSSKREKYKTIFLETNPDLSDNKNKYKLDETNPYELKWIHESTTVNCFNCNGDIRCLVVNKHLYKYCSRCNPSTRFVKYKWNDNWELKKVKILDENKHKWVKPPSNSDYDEKYVCNCEKCKKSQIKINNNKSNIFEKLNLYVNDEDTSNDIIIKLFDIEKSLKVNIKNMKEWYGQNYNFNDNIEDNIKTIVRIYRREQLNEYSEYSSDED